MLASNLFLGDPSGQFQDVCVWLLNGPLASVCDIPSDQGLPVANLGNSDWLSGVARTIQRLDCTCILAISLPDIL
jgi:hypothetical protein